jgi:hypothetical protein
MFGRSAGSERDFIIETNEDGPTLVVTGRWTPAAAETIRRGEADGLWLNYARGYAEPDLSFLPAGLGIRRLLVLDRQVSDLSPLERLADSLEELTVDAATEAAVDLEALPHLTSLAAGWQQVRDSIESAVGLRYLSLQHYDERDLATLAHLEELRELRLLRAPALSSLSGTSCLARLRVLSLRRVFMLPDLDGVEQMTMLEELELEGCTSITNLDPISMLSRLRVLYVNDCGKIDSLAPVADLNLEVFLGWGTTNIADGDLSPVERLPNLKTFRMKSRRHYRPTVAEIQRATPSS